MGDAVCMCVMFARCRGMIDMTGMPMMVIGGYSSIYSAMLSFMTLYKLQAYRTRTLESEFCMGGQIRIDNLP